MTMALRRLETIESKSTGRVAKVYRDATWQEWRVRHYISGTHQADADYHTTDKGEAQQHARSWAWYTARTHRIAVDTPEGLDTVQNLMLIATIHARCEARAFSLIAL